MWGQNEILSTHNLVDVGNSRLSVRKLQLSAPPNFLQPTTPLTETAEKPLPYFYDGAFTPRLLKAPCIATQLN